MNVIWAALTATVLAFGVAEAQSSAQSHGNPQGRPPAIGLPEPQIGGPNRHEFPGMLPNRLSMKPNGEIETVGPNRRDFGQRPQTGQFNAPAERRFQAAPSPGGYRRWTQGERLPPSDFGPDRWITRFGLYGLTAPPPDAVWVRSGTDALLVNRTSGGIVRAQHGLFN